MSYRTRDLRSTSAATMSTQARSEPRRLDSRISDPQLIREIIEDRLWYITEHVPLKEIERELLVTYRVSPDTYIREAENPWFRLARARNHGISEADRDAVVKEVLQVVGFTPDGHYYTPAQDQASVLHSVERFLQKLESKVKF